MREALQLSGRGSGQKIFRKIGRSQGGALSALIIVNGPLYPSRRSMSAAAGPAAPPPMMMIEEGCIVVDTQLGAAGTTFSFTKTFSPTCCHGRDSPRNCVHRAIYDALSERKGDSEWFQGQDGNDSVLFRKLRDLRPSVAPCDVGWQYFLSLAVTI